MLQAGFGLDMFDDAKKEQLVPLINVTRRRLMQTLGTEWGREMVHPSVWLYLAGDHLARRGPGMIISDIRFENEAAWVRRAGGLMIHLERLDGEAVEDHSSENGVARLPEDRVIVNDGSLDDLFAEVKKIVG